MHKFLKISLFIFISKIIFTSCNYQISNESLNSINTSLELSIQQNIKRQEEIFYSSERNKRKPEKFKYSFLFKAIEKAFHEYNDFYELKDDLLNDTYKKNSITEKAKIIFELKDKLLKSDSTVLSSYFITIKENFKTLGLREHEINKRLEFVENKIKESQSNLFRILNENSEHKEVMRLKLNQITLTTTLHQTFFMDQLRELLAGSGRIHFGVFPILNPKKYCLKKGEYFEADIFIGLYHNSFDTSTTSIIVNKIDTIKLNDLGSANYKVKAEKTGDFELYLECLIQDPYDSGFQKYTSTYEYHVD